MLFRVYRFCGKLETWTKDSLDEGAYMESGAMMEVALHLIQFMPFVAQKHQHAVKTKRTGWAEGVCSQSTVADGHVACQLLSYLHAVHATEEQYLLLLHMAINVGGENSISLPEVQMFTDLAPLIHHDKTQKKVSASLLEAHARHSIACLCSFVCCSVVR